MRRLAILAERAKNQSATASRNAGQQSGKWFETRRHRPRMLLEQLDSLILNTGWQVLERESSANHRTSRLVIAKSAIFILRESAIVVQAAVPCGHISRDRCTGLSADCPGRDLAEFQPQRSSISRLPQVPQSASGPIRKRV